MSTPTANQGIPIPDPTDADNVPYVLAQLVGEVETRLAMRFASTTARDATLTSPVEGMVAWVADDGLLTVYNGSAWVDVASNLAYPLPAPQSVQSASSATGNSSGWTDGPSGTAITVVNPHPTKSLRCRISAATQLTATVTTFITTQGTGATTMAASPRAEMGYTGVTSNTTQIIHERIYDLLPGSTVITPAIQTSSGTQGATFWRASVVPLAYV